MRYMLLFVSDEEAWEALPEDERAGAIARIGAWFGRWAGAGKIVEGHRLQGKRSAKTVRLGPAGRSGRSLVVDGPFIESKEAIGSYAIVEVADAEEALAIAASWPAGGTVEIRPLQED